MCAAKSCCHSVVIIRFYLIEKNYNITQVIRIFLHQDLFKFDSPKIPDGLNQCTKKGSCSFKVLVPSAIYLDRLHPVNTLFHSMNLVKIDYFQFRMALVCRVPPFLYKSWICNSCHTFNKDEKWCDTLNWRERGGKKGPHVKVSKRRK